ncbi:MAG: DinB family protein [Bacteroidota bacterium]|jgi:hypothetical protein
MTRSENLVNYRRGFEKLQSALQNYPKQAFDYKPAPDKWSIREIILHLADSESVGYARCRKIIAESATTITPYNQDIWAEELNYKDQDLDLALELFAQLRLLTFKLLEKIPEQKWNNYIIHPERGKVTLEEWLGIYSNHVDVHISQMNGNLAEWQNSKKSKKLNGAIK